MSRAPAKEGAGERARPLRARVLVPEELGLQGGSWSLRYFHSNAEGLKPGSKPSDFWMTCFHFFHSVTRPQSFFLEDCCSVF